MPAESANYLHLVNGFAKSLLLQVLGLQESELAVGWCIALGGFALVFVQWRSEGA